MLSACTPNKDSKHTKQKLIVKKENGQTHHPS